MISFLAFPPARGLEGEVRVPPSKSATNRALVLAALSSRSVILSGALDSDDTLALRACLTAMGARIENVPSGLRVQGPLSGGTETVVLDAKDSGTAARFLLAVAAATPGEFLLTGSSRLRERPMGELAAALRELGGDIAEEGASGGLPLLVRGGSVGDGSVSIDASRSSQFLSALLLLGAAGRRVEVSALGAVSSAPYVDVTIAALRAFGHPVEGAGPWRVTPGACTPDRIDIPGDFSSAIPIACGAGIAGGDVLLAGLAWPSPDADALALPVLGEMGVAASRETGGLRVRARRGGLAPLAGVAATRFPDAVPALAAVAAFAPGTSRFSGVGHLRFKESDRLDALSRLIVAAGGDAQVTGDDLVVRGFEGDGDGSEDGGGRRLPTFRDHRIAMAAALLSLGRSGLLIEDPDCVSKSYPGFFRDLDRLCRR